MGNTGNLNNILSRNVLAGVLPLLGPVIFLSEVRCTFRNHYQ